MGEEAGGSQCSIGQLGDHWTVQYCPDPSFFLGVLELVGEEQEGFQLPSEVNGYYFQWGRCVPI